MPGRRTTIIDRGDLSGAWADAEWHPELLSLVAPIDPAVPAVAGFVERADAAIGTPWPQPLLSDFARYPRDGDRAIYEGIVFARMDRVATAAVAAHATGSTRHLDEVADGIQLLCEQSTWCWPAHDDVFDRTGGVVADPSHPYLDLGAGEVAGLLAWSRFALGDRLDERVPGLDSRVRAELERRVLAPFTARRDWHWLGLDGNVHNWNPWIHGNVIVAAAAAAGARPHAVAGDDAAATRNRALVDLAVDGIDRYLAALPADGGIDEGVAYWWNGAARALDALEVLERAAGGTFDPSVLPGLPELLRFPMRMQLGSGWVFAFADATPRSAEANTWRIPHAWGRRLGLPDVVAHASGFERGAPPATSPNNGLGRILGTLADAGWATAPEPTSDAPPPTSVVLGSLSIALAREHDGAGLAISLKGGHNDESHNHNDLGSVTVSLDGVPAVIDVGRPEYDRRTFGPERYSLWPMRSDWHSVPEPRGIVQSAGAEWRSGPIRGSDDDIVADWSLSLDSAWPLADGGSWTRSIRLDRDASIAEVRDEWTLDDHPETRTTWILWGEATTTDDEGVRLRRPQPAGRDLLIEHDAERVEIEVRHIDDRIVAHSWGDRITRVRLVPRPGARSMTTRFRAADEERR